MGIASVSVNRYVFAAMLNAVIVLFGIVAYTQIGIERNPNVDFPTVTVTTSLPGTDPEVVDASVTNVIEGAVSSIPGMSQLVSDSTAGVSTIRATFGRGKDIDIAFNEVQSKVSQVLGRLPDQAEVPVVSKADTGSFPVFWVALTGNRTIQQLNQYAINVVKPRLETIDGVGEVIIGGERKRTIRVDLDFERLSAFGIGVQDVINAFRNEHLLLPGGYLVSGSREELLKLDLEYHRVEDLERMVIGFRDGSALYLRDVATILDDLSDNRRVGRYNGRTGVGLGIVKVAGRNTVEISREIKRRLNEEIIAQLPPGLELYISSDDSLYILELIASLQEHLIAGALFAALVVWFFLRNLRATLIVAAAIPVSLFGAVMVIFFLGQSLNVITMLALLVLIGVVVDDAIVVLENIQRRVEEGEENRRDAAIEGTAQVLLAVVASTLTLACIFAPVIFLTGLPGKFFGSFGVVVVCGVLVSLFVSITLTPMLCSRYIKVYPKHGPLYRWITARIEGLERGYARAVGWTLAHRWSAIMITGAAVAVVIGVVAVRGIGFALFPPEDEGGFQVILKTPLGTSIEYGDDRMAAVEKVLLGYPEVESVFATMGGGRAAVVTQGVLYVNLKDRSQRDRAQYELMPIVREDLNKVPGVQAFPASFSMAGSARGEALAFALVGPDLRELARHAGTLRDAMAADPDLGNVDLELQLDLPQVRLTVNRDLAAEFGLSTREVAEAANVLAGGLDIAKFSDEQGDGQRYDIRLKAAGDTDLRDLSKIYLRSPNRALIRLDSVAQFEETLGPAVITRIDREYAAQFYSDPSIPLGEALARVERLTGELLPPGYSMRMLGNSEEFAEMGQGLMFAFLLSLIVVYMVLASQFNSFRQPLIIMVAQPLAVFGGLAALSLTGNSLNVFSMIGMVLLVGLVSKNSILLVDITNQFRDQGMSVDEALRVACPRRLRAILMTTLTLVFAMLVPVLGLGAGVELSRPLAVAVVGGLVTSTLLTLLVVPAIYSLVEGYFARRAAASAGLPEPGAG